MANSNSSIVALEIPDGFGQQNAYIMISPDFLVIFEGTESSSSEKLLVYFFRSHRLVLGHLASYALFLPVHL